MSNFENVKPDIVAAVSQNSLASELSRALLGLFSIEYFTRLKKENKDHVVLHCKPTRTVADALLLDREVLAIGIIVPDVQVRTLNVAEDLIRESQGRLDKNLVIVVHADKNGDNKLRAWGRERGIKIIPIFRPKAGALPTAETLRRILAQDLFTQDPFSLTGPVLADSEFFGRRNNALELLRQLQTGRILSIFGIRKLGKTSLINRVVNGGRDAGSPKIAMIDCSVDGFNKLSAADALKAVAKVAKLAANRGYAHISEALNRSDKDLVPVFDDLWSNKDASPLAIIFDEVDYVTPASPTRPHWASDFNIFWREFRVVCQEAQRMGYPLSILVSGVSSQAFRVESFDGIENSVLHFVPESYLSPFARNASKSMIADLCRRCGLILGDAEQEKIAAVCGDFPYWIRMAGSYIHRSVDIQGRPITLGPDLVNRLLEEFVVAEGADAARVALEDLRRKYPEPVELLQRAVSVKKLPLAEGKLLVRYGLASQLGIEVSVTSAMVREGTRILGEPQIQKIPSADAVVQPNSLLKLDTEEWAEELGVLSRRRNIVERKLREFIHFALKLSAGKGESWVEKVLKSLPEHQRNSLAALSGDALLNKLYWKELGAIIGKHWSAFESTIGDKKRFETAMDLVNDRPDTHAKPVDAADIALYRRELTWLEERLS